MAKTESISAFKVYSLQINSLLLRLVGYLTFILVLVLLLPLAVPHIDDALSYSYIHWGMEVEGKISVFVQQVIPTNVAGVNIGRWIVIAFVFVAGGMIGRARRKMRDKAIYLKFKRNFLVMKETMRISDKSQLISPLKKKLETLNTASKKERDELLKLFAETKKKLDSIGKDLAFLSIDVVDSTGMKQGEERAVIEHDFKEYKKFVEEIFRANGYIKAAWTPDGVMSCFKSVDDAVKTAREIIVGLDHFNKNIKSMRRDFVVRCGVNAGYVYFDETVPLEEVSDRVIDVAGHMQKHALPGTVCVAKPAIEPLKEREGFQPSGRLVDGYEVYEWKK